VSLLILKLGRFPTPADYLLPKKDRRGKIVDSLSVDDSKNFWS